MDNIIPRVDLSQFVEGSPEEKQAFVEKLGKAYEDVGFVTVVNHGIADETIDSLYENIKDFFSQSLEYKKAHEIEELAGQRGYTSFGREHAKGSDAPDLKEFYQWGQTVTDNDPIKKYYPDNIPAQDNNTFNDAMLSIYSAFEKSGAYLLRAIALYLNLDENYFDGKIHNGNSILRAIHYPPITVAPKNAVRAEQHEDINLITLLVGASAEGLQVLTKQNEWKSINAGPGEIVVNVGDMLQRLTNNRLRSTTHRVVNPPQEKWHLPRYSVPFFLHPRSEMDLTCLDNCITDENPLQYEPITAGGYLDERLREIGLKK